MKKTEWKSFIKFPRTLIESPDFSDLSVEAKVLLALILDRYGVSEINAERFTDKKGNLYVIYTIEEISEKLGCSHRTASKILKELQNDGLIKKYRDECGKPQKIILTEKASQLKSEDFNKDKKSAYRSEKIAPDKYKKYTSVSKENELTEVSDLSFNYNNNSNNKFSNNKSSIIGFEKTEDEIREQIEYDCIVCDENRELLDEIVMIISDVMSGTSPTVRVGRDDMPRGLAVSRFCRLDAEHILYVLSGIGRSTKKINNIKAYLTTMLYNAPATMEAEAAALFARHYG